MNRFSAVLRQFRTPALFACLLLPLPAAPTADPGVRRFDLPADRAEVALKLFATQSGMEVLFNSDTVTNIRTARVQGEMPPAEALQRLLAGTALTAHQEPGSGIFLIRRTDPADAPKANAAPRAEPAPARNAASSGGSGIVTGRVRNATNGSYLANARVGLEGTDSVTFTSDAGEFTLRGVPAGPARLRVFHTGLEPAVLDLAIEPGATLTREVSLTRAGLADPRADSPVQLDAFLVESQRETNAAAIAINEQRFAANLMNVVAGDEYGDIGEGNVGAFLKFIPGVVVDMAGFQPNTVSVRGVPANNTPLTVDGQPIASAATSGLNRNFELVGLSMNNIARVEVSKSPTPDMSANSLGGAVNVISKTAFELARPQFTYHAFASANGMYLSLGEKPGPGEGTTGWRIQPGGDFSYIVPLSKTFGFTVSGIYFSRFQQSESSQPTWSPISTNNAAGTATNPALISYRIPNAPAILARESASATADWKFSPTDVLTLGLQYTGTDQFTDIVDQTWATGTVAAYDRTSTRGNPGAGTITWSTGSRRKSGATLFSNLKWRHTGPIWQIDGGGAYSRSTNHYRDVDKGFFEQATFTLRNVTIAFAEINPTRPGTMTATTPAGTPIDGTDINVATIGSARSNQGDVLAVIASAHLNARRTFATRFPLSLKSGLDLRREDRDMRNPQLSYTFVGPDRVANTADDVVGRYDLVAAGYSGQRMAWDLPARRWQSTAKLWRLYRQDPASWTLNETTALSTSANNSRQITETISAAYLRADARLFAQRLWLVGGARYEHTEDDAYGVLNDLRATYQQDTQGNLILVNNRPVRVPGDAVALARLQYRDRGTHAVRSYDDFYPSFNATLNLSDNLLARAAYARTLGRPNFQQIIPGTSVSDPTSSTRTITVNNTGLQPWTADNYDLSLEYYFRGGGMASVGVFRKDIANFFGATRTPATAALLAEYDLPDDYLGYDLISQTNIGDARVTGIEYSYRQQLDALHPLARGIGVFFNGTEMQLSGATTADFSGFTDRTINWGVSYSRPRYQAKLNWNLTGRRRNAPLVGANVPPGVFSYTAERVQLDVNLEWRVHRRLAVYFTARNLANTPLKTEFYNAETPEYARLRQIDRFGAAYTFGVKGTF